MPIPVNPSPTPAPSTPEPTPSPGSNLDTGTGGFPIDGNRNTYDIGSTVGDEAKTPWSPGNVKVDQTRRDLSKGTIQTLASYLSRTTLGATNSSPTAVANAYPVDADDKMVSLTDDKGYPTIPNFSSNTTKYVDDKVISSRSTAANNLDILRGRQSTDAIFRVVYDANGEPLSAPLVNGNNLLRNATGELEKSDPVNPTALGGKLPSLNKTEILPTSPIKKYYGDTKNISNSVIYNRFNADNTFESFSGKNGKNLNSAQFASSYELGTSTVDEKNRNISFGRLAQIGNALSIRAGLELGSLDPGNNPTDNAAQTGALLPGSVQLGVYRLERDQLTAESVLQDLTSEGIGSELLIDPAAESWGTLNNVQDQFAGISNFGMQLLAVALLVALSLVVLAMTAIFSIGSAENPVVSSVDKIGRRTFGAWHYDKSGGNYGGIASIVTQIISGNFNLWRLLGLTPTTNPMSKCLPVGALAFFGVDEPGASVSSMASVAAAKGVLAVTQSPGYYSVMARSVNRSFLQIGDSFSSLTKSFASGNITAGVKQLFGIIDVLKSSKFIRAVDVFSQIGDRHLGDPIYPHKNDARSAGAGVRFFSELDFATGMNRIDTVGSEHHSAGTSRIPNAGGKDSVRALTLSWASYRAPDQLLRTNDFRSIVYSDLLGYRSGRDTTGRNPSIPSNVLGGIREGGVYTEENSRISTEDRIEFEKALDSEYVPFYIHDVRTNEIISFHAFLASLTDDYAAAYDTIEAFGRVEPIKMYKSTTRKIGFSFYLAATSQEDFDSMWLKINKLTTLVYPQFNKGRDLERDNFKITVPFSQTIQASPMVRIRIGDLIQSNYSKFNLARLFGYGNADSKFADKKRGVPPDTLPDEIAVQDKIFKGSTFYFIDDSKTLWGEWCLNASVPDVDVKIPGLVFRVTDQTEDEDREYYICTAAVAHGEDTPESFNAVDVENTYGLILSKRYAIPKSCLRPTNSTLRKIRDEIAIAANANNSDQAQYAGAVNTFMSDDEESGKDSGNAIVKSFRSSGGRGLAGFVESIHFDWFDKVTWETDSPGRKAPKMCKVTVAFSPVHDITPGLDHTGMNRAPLYPVGNIKSYDNNRKQ